MTEEKTGGQEASIQGSALLGLFRLPPFFLDGLDVLVER